MNPKDNTLDQLTKKHIGHLLPLTYDENGKYNEPVILEYYAALEEYVTSREKTIDRKGYRAGHMAGVTGRAKIRTKNTCPVCKQMQEEVTEASIKDGSSYGG